MKIHEYQAKELLRQYGAPVPEGIMVTSAEDAAKAAEQYGRCVIKAQVHSGGRGKAGGVKLADTASEAKEIAGKMLGMRLMTAQAGPEGKLVRRLLVTPAADVVREYYLSVTGDMANAGLMLIASAEGGTEIETTAVEKPEAIFTVPLGLPLHDATGKYTYDRSTAAETAKRLGFSPELCGEFTELVDSMVSLYMEKDCSLVEINPLTLLADGHLTCLDAKVNFDDNALYRHPELQELRDIDEEDPKEYRASQFDLNFVSLDGDIGCLVNGAGLAMATMDIIKSFGGEPANFLDVGGSATAEKVAAAFEILLGDGRVRAIFVNIFGGIMKCDIIAEGIITAAQKTALKIPLIVRLEGTNVELGRKLLKESGLNIIAASDMADGARLAVEAAKEVTL